ncbi:sporulation protein YunB [Oscillospiraceae bacterium MB08-C2-2]|nr:sporulation protein YunB [Oscillospiraceae bacterium MB08-C2-2]
MRKPVRRWRSRDRIHTARQWILLFMIGVLIAGFVILEGRLRAVIETVAEHQARVFAVKTINDAMLEQLEADDISYSSLVDITKNDLGEITSIQTNMVAVNTLKAQVTEKVLAAVHDQEKLRVYIPIGTLLGSQLTSGLGPELEIKVIPTGYVQTELQNEFTQAGINQTLHQIILQVSFQISVLVPGYTIQSEVVTNYCVAETVIVGKIPDTVVDLGGQSRPTLSPILPPVAS